MSDFVILLLILLLFLCLIVTVVGFVLYSGLLSGVVIRTGAPPVKKITIAYKFQKGSYRNCGPAFTDSCSIGPKLSSIGIFYDNPNVTPADECRYAVGSVLSEGEEEPDSALQALYEKFGYKIISLPEVPHAVTTSFPNRSPVSPIFGAYRVYPELNDYVTVRRLAAYPFLEICKGDVIYYMCPLSSQNDFIVPEAEEEKKKRDGEREEDRDTDDMATVTGADSETGSGPVARPVIPESSEACLTSSRLPDPPHPQPELPQADGEEEQEEGDHGSKSSADSVASGSSFEELDMDVEEEENETEERNVRDEDSQEQDETDQPSPSEPRMKPEPTQEGQE
ncbi:testis-expressed protein 264 [Chanos chanos]|uniref:Testis-expressed protein 264 n=1 Tax=Chanos chanos TaxID=29144 RepID=A0A6J2VK47_CHACN|nr:testis-expressed protein 264-like [Chanos chanos]